MTKSPGLRNWAPLLLITLMSAALYYPVLFQHKTQIHAEGVSLGVALMHMLSAALHGDTSMLWTTSIYGGHPVFAEGQGGFANPLHLLLAWLLQAVPAYNVNQFVTMLVSGFGAYGMCRSANCGRAAATFAALALIFSTLWIGGRSNLAVGSTMCWIPWVFWAMHSWRRRADLPAACFLGTTMALMVLSGYPQLVHGVIIYLFISFLVELLSKQERILFRQRFKPLAVSLAVAILISIGLSAVQWLPLLELAGESHRSGGISLGGLDGAPAVTFLRGFLYTLADPDGLPDGTNGTGLVYFAAMGSLLACLVFSSLVLFKRNMQTNGHIVATLFLVLLGLGNRGMPFFDLLYDYHLIPGLYSFRVTFVYLYVALVGCSLLSAIALEKLAEPAPAPAAAVKPRGRDSRRQRLFAAAAWTCAWLLVIWYLHVNEVSAGQYYIAAGWLVVCLVALVARLTGILPGVAVLLLCIEIVVFRLDPFVFGDNSLIAKPQSIISLEREGNVQDFKFADRNWANIYSLYPPKSTRVVPGLARLLESVTPAANALWGVSSLTGNTALDLRRRRLADPVIEEELRSGNERLPGLRLIDFVSLKYLSVGESFANPGFREVYTNDELQVRFVENSYAHPRFQFFHEAVFVAGMEEAVAAMQEMGSRTLVVESGPGLPPAPSSPAASGAVEPTFTLLRDSSGRYELEIRSIEAVWLFLADANYPGWRAYIDGRETPVYSAQLLGKAVYVPGGSRRLEIVFQPASVRWGLAVTIATLCLVAFLLVRHLRRPL